MIIWNYKEALEEIKKEVSTQDRKKIACLVKTMAKSGVSKGEIESNLHGVFKNENDFAIAKKLISKECKHAKNNKNFIRENVCFSVDEIKRIKEIENKDVQRILFCIMLFCKSRNVDYIYLGSKSETKPKDITDIARLPYSAKRFEMIMRELYNCGIIYVEPNMKIVLSQICLEMADGQQIKVSKNSVDWLEVMVGRGVFCQRCGVFVKKQGNNKKYCQKCAEIVKKERDKFRKLKN